MLEEHLEQNRKIENHQRALKEYARVEGMTEGGQLAELCGELFRLRGTLYEKTSAPDKISHDALEIFIRIMEFVERITLIHMRLAAQTVDYDESPQDIKDMMQDQIGKLTEAVKYVEDFD